MGKIGNTAAIVGADLTINAYNNVLKEWLSGDAYNVQSKSGALLDIPATKSETLINNTALISVGQNAALVVAGSISNPGQFALNAYNLVTARDKAKLENGGLIAVTDAHSIITCTGNANVQIGQGAMLASVGDIYLTTRDRQD